MWKLSCHQPKEEARLWLQNGTGQWAAPLHFLLPLILPCNAFLSSFFSQPCWNDPARLRKGKGNLRCLGSCMGLLSSLWNNSFFKKKRSGGIPQLSKRHQDRACTCLVAEPFLLSLWMGCIPHHHHHQQSGNTLGWTTADTTVPRHLLPTGGAQKVIWFSKKLRQ